MATGWIGQLFALILMALALGMDAFSVCMGMGMKRYRLDQILEIGLLIGAFHVLMPLLGMALGQIISVKFGRVAGMIGGILLLLIGIQMIFSLVRDPEKNKQVSPSETGIFLFSLSVSLDSFSVGLSMGLFGVRVLAAVTLFGLISMMMAWTGFFIGRRTKKYFGRYGEALGGLIMLLFGLKLLI